jgi:hypothetical protein
MVAAASKTAFQLRISLKDYVPVIWRRLLVPGGITLAKLHLMIQATMGWEGYHLRCFEIDGVRYGITDPDDEMMDIDDETVRMADVIGPRSRFDYEYDFGDSWHHEVVVEAMTRIDLVLKFGVCLDGQRACPPEDVGGVHMFAAVLAAVRDPEHAESPEYLEWLPPDFDPDLFDLAAVNAALQRIR